MAATEHAVIELNVNYFFWGLVGQRNIPSGMFRLTLEG